MKKCVSKYKNWGRVSLLALLSITYSQTYSISDTALISFSGGTALRIEKLMADFFTASTVITWHDFLKKCKNEISQLYQKQEQITRSPDHQLMTDAIEFSEWIAQQFNAVISVFEKHNGKKNEQAFIDDLFTVDFEKILNVSKTKLEALKSKALAANNTSALEIIQKLIDVIEIKRKEWNAKLTSNIKKVGILMAITIRMGNAKI